MDKTKPSRCSEDQFHYSEPVKCGEADSSCCTESQSRCSEEIKQEF